LLTEIASTPAVFHLIRHSDRIGNYTSSATSRDITSDLLSKTPAPNALIAIAELVHYSEVSGLQIEVIITKSAAIVLE